MTTPTIKAALVDGYVEITFQAGKITHGFALEPNDARLLAARLISAAEEASAPDDVRRMTEVS